MSWYLDKGPENDVVLSSRVRLARNLKKYPFPSKMTEELAEKVTLEIKETILEGNSYFSKECSYIALNQLMDIDKVALLEKHLISVDLIKNSQQGGVLLSKDESLSIMVNEEDHVRIQSILPGMQLGQAWEFADKVDNFLEEKIEYAYNENLGYLTSCPTNVGTGMRASVMVHLPALSMIGYINGLLSTVGKLGLAVRGTYGEGSQSVGNLYQISNQVTLGQSEDDILSNISSVIAQITEQERMARNKVLKESGIQLEDKIFRSYGIFANARLLMANECMNLLSDIKLGLDLGMINNITQKDINELMIITQPACLQKMAGRILDDEERDMKRAEVVRKKFIKKGN